MNANEEIDDVIKEGLQRTVKPVYNDHTWNPKIVTVVDKWSLFRGTFML